MENDQQLFHTILGSYEELEHMEIPKLVFLQLFHIFLGSNTGQEHQSILPTDNDQQLFHTIFGLISICYIFNKIRFPINNFLIFWVLNQSGTFSNVSGFALTALSHIFLGMLIRYIFQYTRLSFSRFSSHILGVILFKNQF